MKDRLTYLILIILNLVADQISKVVIRAEVGMNEHIELIGNYFIMTHVENEGAFLSLGSDFPAFLRISLLLVLPALVMVGGTILLFLKKDIDRSIGIAVTFLIGGGIGNLIDRIAFGSVTDFLHIDLGAGIRTGIFNVADMSIMLGMGLLLLKFFKDNRRKKAEEAEAGDKESSPAEDADSADPAKSAAEGED